MKYDLIIFDLGNVILRFDHNISAGKMLQFSRRFNLDKKKVHDLFFDSLLTCLHDEGKLSSRLFYTKVKDALNIDPSYADFKKYWNDIFAINRGVPELIRKLKGRYKLYLMSNTNKLHFDFIRKKFGVVNEFDRVILSYKVGVRKPHPKIYRYALRIARTTPQRAVYIDDRPELVAGARGIGMKAIQFKGLQQLKRDLRVIGLGV